MTAGFDIRHSEGDTKGSYALLLDGHRAELTYSRLGEASIIIDHTEVPDALRGRGVGQALVERAVQDARKDGRKIVPLCTYAKAQIARRPE